MKDPDGNEWEVFVVKGDTDTMSDDKAVAKAACCTPSQKDKAKASGGCCG